MKFTQSELLEKLKAKLTAGGKKLAISEKTLTSQVETLYKYGVKEETELEDFVKEVLPTLETLEGNYRKDNSEFIKKWEKEHPDTKPTPPAPPTPPMDPKNPNGGDERLEALLKAVEDLKKDISESKRQKTISEKRASLIAKFKEKGVKDEEWITQYLDDTAINEETDIDEKAEKALKLYNKSQSKHDPDPTPTPPGGNPSNGQDDYKDIVARIKRDRKIEEK